MNKYFAFIDGTQQGPFDLLDLKSAGVRPSTYVWCKGMDDWTRADEVEEIRNLFRRHLEDIKDAPKETTVRPVETKATPEQNHEQQVPPVVRFGRIPASEEPAFDLDTPPQVSMTLAVLSLILCFIPTGIAAVIFTRKSQKTWIEAQNSSLSSEESANLKKQAHEYERQAKMWLGLTVAFGIIFWTLIFSVQRS